MVDTDKVDKLYVALCPRCGSVVRVRAVDEAYCSFVECEYFSVNVLLKCDLQEIVYFNERWGRCW